MSDPVFMRKHGEELKKDPGKWIDHSVWHGKPHTWEKVRWLIGEVRHRPQPARTAAADRRPSGSAYRTGARSC